MSIYKRSTSPYYYCEIRINSVVVIRSTRSTSKALARRFEAHLREKMYRQQYLGEFPSIPMSDAITLYANSKVSACHSLNLATRIRDVRRQISRVMPLSTNLDELRSYHLSQLVQIRRMDEVAEGTINVLLATLRSVIATARQSGYLTPELSIPVLKVNNSRTQVLSDEQEGRLLAVLEPYCHGVRNDSYDLAILLLDTAARLNEIQGLQWKDVDLSRREINLWRGKTRTEGLVKMTDRALRVLQARYRDVMSSALVFPSKTGGARRCAPKALQAAYKKVGLVDFKTHDLRHTAASRLIRRGMSLYEVSQILGHSSVQMSQRYAHLEAEAVAVKAAQILNQ